MSTPQMNSPLDGCTTIDSETPNGYLDNARIGNKHAGANATTHEAARNLLHCAQQKSKAPPANIVGHGCEGDIDTGKANHATIRFDNVNDWRTDMATLAGGIQELFLFGCSVGAGEDGAKLLFELAKVVKVPVSAPNSVIYCSKQGDFSLPKGAMWQTAHPTQQPAAIAPPTQTQASSSMDKAELQLPDGRKTVEIVSALYTPYGKASLSREDSMRLAHEVVWNQPFTTDDEPGAKVTGHFEIVAEIGDLTIRRSIHVLAHHLLRDGSTYYPVTPRFRDLLGKK